MFQVPGWVVAAAVGVWLNRSMEVPAAVIVGLPAFWILKDMALYPFLRSAYETSDTSPIERLVGAQGKTVETLAPLGYVRIAGELWRAETDTGPVAAGTPVEVIGANGLVLQVRESANAQRNVDSNTNA
jgi:membrane protein implicated in regulation of membrane protease activity